MTGSAKRRDGLSPSLFPFLAVLLCTMGALVLILMLSVSGAQTAAQQIATEIEEQVELEEAKIELVKKGLTEQLDEIQIELEKKRLGLQHLEEHIRELMEELDQLERQAELAEDAKDSDNPSDHQREEEISELEKQLAEATKELQQKLEEPDGDKPIFAIIPYDGPNGTHRRPIYLECTDKGVVIQPEGVVVSPSDLRPPYGPGNPLDAALRTIRAEFPTKNGSVTSNPYPLLIVRPSGIKNYMMARAAMSGWDDQFGYELVSEGLDLSYPPSLPQLPRKIAQALDLARQRQAALIMAMPQHYAGTEPSFSDLAYGSDNYSSSNSQPGGVNGALDWESSDPNSSPDSWAGASGPGNAAGGIPTSFAGGQTGFGPGQSGFSVNSQGFAVSSPQGSGDFSSMGALQGDILQGDGLGGSSPTGSLPGELGASPGDVASGGPSSPGFANGYPAGMGMPGQGQPGFGAANFGGSEYAQQSAAAGGSMTGEPGGTGMEGAALGGNSQSSQSGSASSVSNAAGSSGAAGENSSGSQAFSNPGSTSGNASGMMSSGSASSISSPIPNISGNFNSRTGSASASESGTHNSSMAQSSMAGPSGGSNSQNSQFAENLDPNQPIPPSLNMNLSKGQAELARPVALARGANWAWDRPQRTQTSVIRAIRIRCYVDRWVLLPDKGTNGAPETIDFEGTPAQRAEKLAEAVQRRVESWGVALAGGYWTPVLHVDVARDADWRFDQLQRLMQGSGIDVLKKETIPPNVQ